MVGRSWFRITPTILFFRVYIIFYFLRYMLYVFVMGGRSQLRIPLYSSVDYYFGCVPDIFCNVVKHIKG